MARAVELLYKAMDAGEAEAVAGLLAPDIEWRFHGPPRRQHMMRMLTGEASLKDFRFWPRRVAEIRDLVVVEGWEEGDVVEYWVHVWTVKDGVITQFREYFNTSVTLRKMGLPAIWRSQTRRLGLSHSLPELVLVL